MLLKMRTEIGERPVGDLCQHALNYLDYVFLATTIDPQLFSLENLRKNFKRKNNIKFSTNPQLFIGKEKKNHV